MKKFLSAGIAAAALCVTVSGCQTSSASSVSAPAENTFTLRAEDPVKVTAGDKRPYAKLVETYAKANGVPVDLAHAVIFTESTYNPKARGAAGEIGLMQIRPATARMMGYTGKASGLYDPATNIKYGMKYLGGAHKLAGGSTCGTILKYNAGHGARSMNPVSRAYCGKVTRLLAR